MSKNYARMSAAIAMTLSSTVALAQDYQKGFYIGLNTGASFVTGQTYDELTPGAQLATFGGNLFSVGTTIYRDEDSARGYNGGVLLGWNFYCDDQFIYSLEVSGNLFSNRAHQDFWSIAPITITPSLGVINFEESWDLTYSADLIFKPGYFVSNCTQVFAIIGGSIAQLNTRLKNLTPNTAFSNPFEFEDNKTIYGLVVGAGIQKQICNCISFLASYEYTYYGKQDLDPGRAGFFGVETDFTVNVDRSIRIDTNVFKVGFAYTFPA